MDKHTCETYLSIDFSGDKLENVELLKERRDCTPEELGILNKDEVESFIINELGVTPIWKRHHFIIGLNKKYHTNVNEMLRVTLKGLIGKEEKIKEMQQKYQVAVTLQIVPHLVKDSNDPLQILSLASDIIAFLYKANIAYDIDYYVE